MPGWIDTFLAVLTQLTFVGGVLKFACIDRIEENKKRLESLEDRQAELEKKVSLLENDLENQQKQIDRIENKLDNMMTIIQNMAISIAKLVD